MEAYNYASEYIIISSYASTKQLNIFEHIDWSIIIPIDSLCITLISYSYYL